VRNDRVKTTSFNMDVDFMEAFKDVVRERRTNQTEAVREALAAWMGLEGDVRASVQHETTVKIPLRYLRYAKWERQIEALVKLLETSTPAVKKTITDALKVFGGLVEGQQPQDAITEEDAVMLSMLVGILHDPGVSEEYLETVRRVLEAYEAKPESGFPPAATSEFPRGQVKDAPRAKKKVS
jgi:hypothetical protein